MTTTGLEVFDTTTQKTMLWLKEIDEELGWKDRQTAYDALRGCLQLVRDHLSIDEMAHLGAQLPMLVRGIYYEGWDPSKTPVRYRGLADFLSRVAAEAGLDGETEASYAVSAATRVLGRHVSFGELEDVRAILPSELRAALN